MDVLNSIYVYENNIRTKIDIFLFQLTQTQLSTETCSSNDCYLINENFFAYLRFTYTYTYIYNKLCNMTIKL